MTGNLRRLLVVPMGKSTYLTGSPPGTRRSWKGARGLPGIGCLVEWRDRQFTLVDTGGLPLNGRSRWPAVHRQAEMRSPRRR